MAGRREELRTARAGKPGDRCDFGGCTGHYGGNKILLCEWTPRTGRLQLDRH